MAQRCYTLCNRINKHKCFERIINRECRVNPQKSYTTHTDNGAQGRDKSISVALQTACHYIHNALLAFKTHGVFHSRQCKLSHNTAYTKYSEKRFSHKKCRRTQGYGCCIAKQNCRPCNPVAPFQVACTVILPCDCFSATGGWILLLT